MYWQVKDHRVVKQYLALYEAKLHGAVDAFFESERAKAIEWLKERFPGKVANDKGKNITQDIVVPLVGRNAGWLLTEMTIEVKELWENFMDEVRPEAIGWI